MKIQPNREHINKGIGTSRPVTIPRPQYQSVAGDSHQRGTRSEGHGGAVERHSNPARTPREPPENFRIDTIRPNDDHAAQGANEGNARRKRGHLRVRRLLDELKAGREV